MINWIIINKSTFMPLEKEGYTIGFHNKFHCDNYIRNKGLNKAELKPIRTKLNIRTIIDCFYISK